MKPPMQQLFDTLPQQGTVSWIGLRPARRVPVVPVPETLAQIGAGLTGDRFYGAPDSKRQVTLIQAEHVAAIASFLGLPHLDPALLRRNIVVRGLNLLALKDKQFQIGEAVLEMTGPCHPCSRMEETLGPGGYNALRGHGGITARVLQEGRIRVGDMVRVLATAE